MPEPVGAVFAVGLSLEPAPQTPKGGPARAPIEVCRAWKAFRVLDHFCLASGFAPVRAQRLPAEHLPPPYRALLAHSQDMTSTLERHYGAKTGLRVLRREQGPRFYSREVLLTTARHGAVEYGVIEMDLTWFAKGVRERIVAGQLPLGRLLRDHGIAHLCWPQGFFRCETNGYLETALGLRGPATLYGRRNVIVNGARRLLADVLEILAPQASGAAETPEPAPNHHGHEQQ
jgi:chorismate-pyruvate lyase